LTNASVPAGLWIGHINLGVTDLDRAVRFYRDVLGFHLRHADDSVAFLSAGDYYHHIVLSAVEKTVDSQASAGTVGLRHFALNYPERRDLAAALKRLLDHGWGIDAAALKRLLDHGWGIDAAAEYGTHEAIYLHDPDGNGLELAWDGDPTSWARNGVSFYREPLDFASLLAELDNSEAEKYLPSLASYK
jgi:catechol 2,3-dioxygenase